MCSLALSVASGFLIESIVGSEAGKKHLPTIRDTDKIVNSVIMDAARFGGGPTAAVALAETLFRFSPDSERKLIESRRRLYAPPVPAGRNGEGSLTQ